MVVASTAEVESFVVVDGSDRMPIPWNTHNVGGARDEDDEEMGGPGQYCDRILGSIIIISRRTSSILVV